MSRPLVVGATASLLFFVSLARPASAQIHWDASAQVGVQKRFLANKPRYSEQGGDADFGPTAMLNAHVALLPLLRIGAYIGHDISPMQNDDYSARDLTWGGVRAKILSPWPRGDTRAYAFVGFGYDRTYARSTSRTYPYNGGSAEDTIDGASGSFFEVPFGLGATYTFWKPWALVVELGMRAGFGFTGTAYSPPGPTIRYGSFARGGDRVLNVEPSGDDSFGIGLTAGVMLDR